MTSMESVIESTWPWPLWTAVVGLMAFVAAAWLLYHREPAPPGRGWRWSLLAARLVLCVTLVWMLGGWQWQRHRTEPAQLVVALDDSASMSFRDEYRQSLAVGRLKTLFPNSVRRTSQEGSGVSRFQLARAILASPQAGWLQKLEQNYRVKLCLVADSLREATVGSADAWSDLKPNQPASRLGQGVRDLLSRQQGIPTAAIILFTDGVSTMGPTLSEAAATAAQQGIPLFLVGMGGGQPPRDVRLADLLADDVAFAGDVFQAEVQLLADGLQAQQTTVQMRRTDTGEILAQQKVSMQKGSVRLPVRLMFRPQTVGWIPLEIEAVPVSGESDVANNRLTHTLHVNDVTIKVLLVQAYPSYEYRFLKNLLSRATKASDASAKAFELTTILQGADREHVEQDAFASRFFPVQREELNAFDVVLFGDVDPSLLGRAAIDNLLAYVRDHGGSIVFLAGPRFTPIAYRDTPLAQLFPFQASTVTVPELPIVDSFAARLTPVGALSPACQLENAPADNAAAWNALPELFWFVDIPSPNAAARVLLEHPTRTNSAGRSLPLILTQYVNTGRVVFHATDESYRWSRFRGSDEYYARYWLQTLRMLSRAKLQAGASPAEITTDRQQYFPGDEVRLRVRFRQERADLESVTVTLEHSSGARHPVIVPQGAAQSPLYTAVVRDLPAGSYQVSMNSPLLDPSPLPRSFRVADRAQEQIGVPLDSAEMQRAAKISKGQYYAWFDAERALRDLPQGQRVRVESLPPKPIWNSSWIAGAFVAILTLEWLLRKRCSML